jgi:hypothetical protein
MLNRADWILLFLGSDAGPYPSDQVRVMKGLFLLSQDPAHPLNSQYRFEAYDYGPFDAMVYRDLDSLQLEGLISVQRWAESTRKTYGLTDRGGSDSPSSSAAYYRNNWKKLRPSSVA